MKKKTEHAFIPDTQIAPWVPTEHIAAAGNYLAYKQPDTIVVIGDWWDMHSLSSFDKAGCVDWELRNVEEDFECGRDAMADFLRPIKKKSRSWKPRLVFCIGNHEHRLWRARQDPNNRKFRSYLSNDNFQLNKFGFKVVPFLERIDIDGILYSHYFTGGVMDRALGGMIETKLKNLCQSFSMGHQQTYQVGVHYTGAGKRIRGLVNGTFYQHAEDYISVQGNARTYRGMFYKHEVYKGNYDLMEISIDYLLENWQ